jgi:DNA helicase-2/ATP-dependent DNA helicase PcrA
MRPTKQQKLILEYDDSAVVIAAPGSGKTFVISEKIKNNLKELQEHQGIIAISYTNKASNELKSRSLSNGENPKASFFGTIDKFNLSEIIIPFGKHLFGLPEADLRITKINTLDLDTEENPFMWFTRDLKLVDITHSQMDTLEEYFRKGIIMIETIGILADFVFNNSLACRNYIKAKYKYIYIDEYQDSGYEQHQIFVKINKLGLKAIAVGDLNQSIYAFSGKDSKYLEALTDNENFKYFKLDKNHRCHASLINYSNYLLNPKTELIPTAQNHIWFHSVQGKEQEVALWIDGIIPKIQKLFKISDRNQIAILTRTTRTGELINDSMKSAHKLSIANELDNNLNIWSAIFSNLLHFTFDGSFKFIDVIEIFSSYEKFNQIDLQKLADLKKGIENIRLQESLDTKSLKSIFKKIALIIAPNSVSAESLEMLSNVLENPADLKSYEPANKDEVNILTLHKSKGLEYDFVLHLDLHEWVFPNKAPGPNSDWNNPVYGSWTQDLNLHYVGITRARKGCYLVSSSQRTNNQNRTSNAKDSEFVSYNNIEDLRYISKK